MFKRVIATTALCGVLPAFAAGPNLIVDYGFEQVSVASGQFAYFTGTQLTGWTVTSGQIEVRDNLVGTAQEGSNFVELDSTANSSMSTSFNSVANQVYTLSFYYSGRPTSSLNGPYAGTVVPSSSMGITVSVGTFSNTIYAPTNATANNVWQLYTSTFTGTGNIMTLSFAAAGTSDSYGASLDHVSVTANTTPAIPEPTSVAMMGTGMLGLLGIGLRRRKR